MVPLASDTSADDADALRSAGAEALRAGHWARAREQFAQALLHGDDPATLAGLGDALWWLGETEAAIRCDERAYAAFSQRGEPVQAARTAIGLYFLYRISLGNTAASRGWLGRLARIVEEGRLAPLEGWVWLLRAHDTEDSAAAERWARKARELARQFQDADLELSALSQLGAALVQMGRTEEGVPLLDEAMAGSLAGESEQPHTVVYTSCNMISSCSAIAQIGRVTQWIRAADEFMRRYGSPHLYTVCRSYYGGVLFATGDWQGAERELTEALRMGKSAEPALHAEALARLAELRLAQGRREEAARLLEGFEDHAATAAVLAALRLEQGDSQAAARIAGRRLRELDDLELRPLSTYRAGAAICVEAATVLEILVDARIALRDEAEALETARRLEELGTTTACELIVARAHRARGKALAATHDTAGARARLERAASTFERLGIPPEVARTRLALAQALRRAAPDDAVAEARAALAAFETLGGGQQADAAAELLRSLGIRAARRGSRDSRVASTHAIGELTKRELQVLRLLGEGLSNRELGERLSLRPKTVEHHVHNVLWKLGLKSRAQAAAYAIRELERRPAIK